jgi:hypothetical protein
MLLFLCFFLPRKKRPEEDVKGLSLDPARRPHKINPGKMIPYSILIGCEIINYILAYLLLPANSHCGKCVSTQAYSFLMALEKARDKTLA